MSKAELERRIAVLEAEVAILRARPVEQHHHYPAPVVRPVYPQPSWTPPTWWQPTPVIYGSGQTISRTGTSGGMLT